MEVLASPRMPEERTWSKIQFIYSQSEFGRNWITEFAVLSFDSTFRQQQQQLQKVNIWQWRRIRRNKSRSAMALRNLTEVFVLMRNNAHHNKNIYRENVRQCFSLNH